MFLDPQHIISQFDLQSGSRVADLGAGSGALALCAAHAVGEAGKVYAVEVQKDLLERLKKEAREARLRNLEVLWGDCERLEGTGLKAGSIDAAIASQILFQIEDRDGFAKECSRILRKGGRMLLVENALRVLEEDALSLFEKNGFTMLKKIETGQNQYGIIFRK